MKIFYALAMLAFLLCPSASFAYDGPDDPYLDVIDEAIRQNSPLAGKIRDISKKTLDALDANSPKQMLRNLKNSGVGDMTTGLGADAIRGALGKETGDAMIRQGEMWLQSYRSFLNSNGTANSGAQFDPYSARGKTLWPKK